MLSRARPGGMDAVREKGTGEGRTCVVELFEKKREQPCPSGGDVDGVNHWHVPQRCLTMPVAE